jgi:hypothetical protein
VRKLRRLLCLLVLGAAAIGGNAVAATYQRGTGYEYQEDDRAITILFVNGIKNDASQVEASSERLISSIKASGLPERTYNFDYFYNPTSGFVEDSSEVAEQIAISDIYLQLAGGDKSRYYALLGRYYNEQSRSTSSLSPERRRIVNTAARLRDSFQLILTSSAGLVVVPHSQGNLYAEAAYAMLVAAGQSDLAGRIRVVGVGAASATTPSDRYITHSVDELITFLEPALAARLSLTAFAPLPANTTACTGAPVLCGKDIDWSGIDPLKHGFQSVYLNRALADSSSAETFPRAVFRLVQGSLSELGGSRTGVLFGRDGADQTIQLAPPGGLRYYFLGYQAAGDPPNQPNFWTATQSIDVVRIRLVGGTGTCLDLGPAFGSSSRLIGANGQTIASLVLDPTASSGGYCVFRTAVPTGSQVAAIELNPGLLSDKTFVFGGSNQNSGRTLSEFGTERTGGFAFQFCSGLCNEPINSPVDPAVVYQQTFDTDPGWQTDQPANFRWNNGAGTYTSRTFSGVPTYSPNRFATIQLPSFDPNRGFVLEWHQRLIGASGNAKVHFGLYSSDRLAEKAMRIGIPTLTPESTVNFSIGYTPGLGLGDYGLQVVGANGEDRSRGIGSNQLAAFGQWYQVRLSYNPVSSNVELVVTDLATGTVVINLVNQAAGAFSSGMQYLGISNHPTGYHPGLVWALTPDGYLDAEFDNVSLSYASAQSQYAPTLSISPTTVQFGGSATLTWNTGGAPLSACTLTRGSTPLPAFTAPTGTYVETNAQGQVRFTLTCGTTSRTATLSVVPQAGGS